MRFTSQPLGSSVLPHSVISATLPLLFMWYTLAGDGWSASSRRAGLSSAMSVPGSPISTTMPILSRAPLSPSRATPEPAASRRSSAALVTLIVPVYGSRVPATVMFVSAANVTSAASALTVTFSEESMPPGTTIAAAPPRLTTLVTKLSAPIATGGDSGGAAATIPALALLFTVRLAAPANRLPRGSGGSDASGAMSTYPAVEALTA